MIVATACSQCIKSSSLAATWQIEFLGKTISSVPTTMYAHDFRQPQARGSPVGPVLPASPEAAPTLRALRCHAVPPRSGDIPLHRAVPRRSLVLLSHVQVRLQRLSEGHHRAHGINRAYWQDHAHQPPHAPMRAHALLPAQVRPRVLARPRVQHGVQRKVPPAVLAQSVHAAVPCRVCAVHGAVHVAVRARSLPRTLRIGMKR